MKSRSREKQWMADADDSRSYGEPELEVHRTIDLRNCVGSDLVPISIEILNQTIVRPLVRHEKRRTNLAAVGIATLTRIEKHFEHFIVDVIDRVLECDENQLWRFFQR